MDPRPASISEADFAILAHRAGLTLDPAQRTTLYAVYGHFEAMVARNRSPGGVDRPRGAEPAHIFVPGQGWTS